MEYHPVVKHICDLLEQHDCWYESFEHEPVRTSEEAADVRHGYVLEQGAKAIIVRVKKSKADKFFAMLVFPGHLRFDTDIIKRHFQAKDIRFATEDELSEMTGGVQPGAVPPFGNLFDLKVLVDQKLLENEKIVFNAGDRRFSVAMKSDDYTSLVNPEKLSFSKQSA